MEDRATSKMAERKDMLLLAQQKLDKIHHGNLGLSAGGGGRPGSAFELVRIEIPFWAWIAAK